MDAAKTTLPVVTPDTDLNTLPKVGGYAGSTRLYFFDLDTREELVTHPLNGCGWSASHGMAHYRGMYIDDTCTGLTAVIWTKSGQREGKITAATFPGRRVAVKEWHGPGHIDWSILTDGDGSTLTGARPDDVPADMCRTRTLTGRTDTVVDGKAYARRVLAA